MFANTFGTKFRVTTFGESHGPAMGVVIDGCPAGLNFDHELLLRELARRRPGSSNIVSARNEADTPEILSGVFEGKTLGTPIAILIRNQDARSEDYATLANNPRAGHADDMWQQKFGHVDPRGGGRSSGRETVSRVMAGAVAQMLVRSKFPGITVAAQAVQIGPLTLPQDEAQLENLLVSAKAEGKSYGGVAELRLENVPQGLGEPVFRKFKSDLAQALMSVGATIGVEFGAGFAATQAEGSEFHGSSEQEKYGGIRGGITTGEPILARVAFKPTASVLDVAKKGRHDPCIVPRALPVLEAMSWLVLAEHVV